MERIRGVKTDHWQEALAGSRYARIRVGEVIGGKTWTD